MTQLIDNIENKITKNLDFSKKSFYIYNRDKSILYYSTRYLKDFFNLGIHIITLKKHLKNGTYYLGKYKFSKEFVPSAKYEKLSFSELNFKLKKEKEKFRRIK